METRQLILIDNNQSERNDWRLDEHTRQLGLKGVAEARRALQEALARPHRPSESSAA